jgi:ABC-type uncharacterized transport system permease subunit
MNFNVEPLLLIMLIAMGVLGYFNLDYAIITGIIGVGLMVNKLFTQLKTIRQNLSRWELVVGKLENAMAGPLDQAQRNQQQ